MPNDHNENLRTTHDLDLVELSRLNHLRANTDAQVMKGMLKAHGIESYVSGLDEFTNYGFSIKVARQDLPEAQRLLNMVEAGTLDLKNASE